LHPNYLKPKQRSFIEAFRSQKYLILVAAGTAGSGKSFTQIGLLHLLASELNNVRFAIIRKSEKNLKQTSIPTYNKVKAQSQSAHSSFMIQMTAKYPKTNSEILFIWADTTKDPDLDNIKGLELTGALIEEAPQIDKRYFDLLKTRVGRWNNQSIKPFIMLNLNPSLGWCRDLFYDKWINRVLPDNTYFEQFDVEDLNDLVKGGILTADYTQTLKDLPEEEYRRFVENNWNYSEITNQLIRYEWYKNCCVEQPYVLKTDRSIMAVDVAWDGSDATGFGQMHGNHMGWWEEYASQDPGETGHHAINRAAEYGVKPEDVIIDAIGVGAGSVFTMRENKFYPSLFIAGETPSLVEGYLKTANKRAEAHWLLREALRKEEITLTHHPKLQKHLLAAEYDVTDKVIKIEPKEKIKAKVHESPTFLDLAAMLAHRYYTTGDDLSRRLIQRQLTQRIEPKVTTRAERERRSIIQSHLIGV